MIYKFKNLYEDLIIEIKILNYMLLYSEYNYDGLIFLLYVKIIKNHCCDSNNI